MLWHCFVRIVNFTCVCTSHACYIPHPSHPNNFWLREQIMKIHICHFLQTQAIFLSYVLIRGVFNNRPNFLNSAPTSIESAPKLLSAPSVRFCQQTAICPISPWILIVEVLLLNWASAQTVRLINDKVTMKEFEEERVCVCVCEILLQTW